MSIGSVSRPTSAMAGADREAKLDKRAKQGLLSPGLEMRVVDDDDKPVAWDGEAFGELLVRGPSVVEEYYDRPEADATDFVAADDGGGAVAPHRRHRHRRRRRVHGGRRPGQGRDQVGRRVDLQHRVGERLDGPRGRRRGGRDRGVALAGAPAGVRRAEGGPRARRRGDPNVPRRRVPGGGSRTTCGSARRFRRPRPGSSTRRRSGRPSTIPALPYAPGEEGGE